MDTDEKQRGKEAAALSGGHLCHVCGYQYPNPHPSAKLRRSHRKHCGKAAPAAVEEEQEAVVGVPTGDREERNAGGQALPGTCVGFVWIYFVPRSLILMENVCACDCRWERRRGGREGRGEWRWRRCVAGICEGSWRIGRE
jgi:hypothetical protein